MRGIRTYKLTTALGEMQITTDMPLLIKIMNEIDQKAKMKFPHESNKESKRG